MRLFTISEFIDTYASGCELKVKTPINRLFIQGIMAGFFIGLGGVAASTVSHSIVNAGMIRLLSGTVFPFGLIMAMLTGAELFTGNCLMILAVIKKRINFGNMLRNLAVLYAGNTAGVILLAVAYSFSGLLNYSDGGLAVYIVKQAVSKCSYSFSQALFLGVLCNILVCTAVMIALRTNEMMGRAVGAYVPISIFVISGFEHSIANLFLVPTGLFALLEPHSLSLIQNAGIDISNLTWVKFLTHNLFPVTLGNLIGGIAFGLILAYNDKSFIALGKHNHHLQEKLQH